jgi:putative intracellular protease/amidase
MSHSPKWYFHGNFDYPTGIEWADIDNNGWSDLVLTNGCDATGRYCAVYFNNENGLSKMPGWKTAEVRPYGNIRLGDFDNDGDFDMVVSLLGLGQYGFPPERHHVYLNDEGLSRQAGWKSQEGNSFSCAMGDPDGDGDLDIGFAQGTNSLRNPDWIKWQKAVIYTNNDGILDTVPSWETDTVYHSVEILFADIDNDGDQDVVISGRKTGILVFENDFGQIATSPSWKTKEIVGGRQMAFGDVDSDGYEDLAVAGIEGGFYLFKNIDGQLEETPSWACSLYQEPSAVAWGDVDGDGDLDLAGTGWFSHLGVFENKGGKLSDEYEWSYFSSGLPYWGQQVVWADYDEDLLIDTVEIKSSNGLSGLHYLAHKPLHALNAVIVNGDSLSTRDYCFDPLESWISLKVIPEKGTEIKIDYTYSHDLDLTVTSSMWCKLFENQNIPDTTDVRVLLVTDSAYGCNYNIYDYEGSIRRQLELFGWNIDLAAPFDTIAPCSSSGYFPYIKAIPSDLKTGDLTISDICRYDAVVLLPNNTGQISHYNSPHFLNLISAAADSGLVIAAWCRSVRLLAAAGVINEKKVVGNKDYASEYEQAGAIYLGSDHPPVTEGNIVTIVRSRFYRTEGCNAIARAVEKYGYQRRGLIFAD